MEQSIHLLSLAYTVTLACAAYVAAQSLQKYCIANFPVNAIVSNDRIYFRVVKIYSGHIRC